MAKDGRRKHTNSSSSSKRKCSRSNSPRTVKRKRVRLKRRRKSSSSSNDPAASAGASAAAPPAAESAAAAAVDFTASRTEAMKKTLKQNLRKRRSSSSSSAKKRSSSKKRSSCSSSSSRPAKTRKGKSSASSRKGRSLSDRKKSSSKGKEASAKKGKSVLSRIKVKKKKDGPDANKEKTDSPDEEEIPEGENKNPKVKKKKDGPDANKEKKGDSPDANKEKDSPDADKIKKKKEEKGDARHNLHNVMTNAQMQAKDKSASKSKSASKEIFVPKESGKRAKTPPQLALEARFGIVEEDVGKTDDAAKFKADEFWGQMRQKVAQDSLEADPGKPTSVVDTNASKNDAAVVSMTLQDDKIMNLEAEIEALRGSMIGVDLVEDGWMLDLQTEINILREVIKENEMQLVEEPAENSAAVEHPNAKLRRANDSLQETLDGKLEKLLEAKAKPLGYPGPEEDPEKMRRELASIREMLEERVQRQMAIEVSLETKDQEARDLKAEIDILRGIVRETEMEFCCMGITFVRSEEKEKELVKEHVMTGRDHVEETEMDDQTLQIDLSQSAEDIRAKVLERAEKARKEAEAVLSREPHSLEAPIVDPPIELPTWCVTPRRQDIVTEVELVRVSSSTDKVMKRIWFAQRSWALLGRKPAHTPVSGSALDIGLAAVRASRSHALLLRNWLGQVFLMDLGSPNGTFMDSKRLKPQEATEWKIGSTVYFGDSKPEVFELRLWKAVSCISDGQVGSLETVPAEWE